MATCKHTGLRLSANLVNDERGRPGRYRYKSADGKHRTIICEATDPLEAYREACDLADQANELRGINNYSSKSIRYWVDRYVEWMQRQNPRLAGRAGWRNRVSSLKTFAAEHHQLQLRQVSVGALSSWWDRLTYDQQHNRRSNYSQFFQWAMAQGAAMQNPFNTSDAIPHLIQKKKPPKRRLPINNMEEFQAIYRHAEDFVQVAMMISLTTTMRAGDVAALKFSDVVNGQLQRTIAKSANQRGAMAASHHGWDLSVHTKLAQAIRRGRELAFSRLGSPPYIVNKEPRGPKSRKDADHPSQVTANDLSRGFAQAVKACGRWAHLPEGRTPPTFHEVRGLAIDLLLKSGIDITAVQRLAAHTDQAITSGYTANHPPLFVDLGIVVNDEVLK